MLKRECWKGIEEGKEEECFHFNTGQCDTGGDDPFTACIVRCEIHHIVNKGDEDKQRPIHEIKLSESELFRLLAGEEIEMEGDYLLQINGKGTNNFCRLFMKNKPLAIIRRK